MSTPRYESISAYLVQIEDMLVQGLSPRVIADRLGVPEKYKTISRYKKDVFDFKRAASEEWTEEKQKGHEERFNRGKDRIVDNYEFLNRLKLKADSLLDFSVGDTYTKHSKEGEETTGIITPHSLSEIYAKAGQIGSAAIKAEQELAGDDPESRKASALEELGEPELRAILAGLESVETESSCGQHQGGPS